MRISKKNLLAFAWACVLLGTSLLIFAQVSGSVSGLGNNATAAQFDPSECDITVSPGSGSSLNSIVRDAPNGSTICLRAGVYQEQMIVRPVKNDLTITGYPGERPIIDGNRRIPGGEFGNLVQIMGTNIIFQGFDVRHSTGRGIVVTHQAENVLVRDVDVHDNWQSGILVKGNSNANETTVTYARNVTIEDSRVYNNIRKARFAPVIYRADRTGTGAADWLIDPDIAWDTPVWTAVGTDLPEQSLDSLSLVLDGSGNPTRVYASNGSTATSYVGPDFSSDGQEIAYAAHDILYHTPQTNKWTLYFDGTSLGLADNSNINAFWVEDEPVSGGCGECYPVLLSFNGPTAVPGLGTVDGGDIIQFTPTQVGRQTQGTFTIYRTAAQLGLGNANIDVLDFAPPPAGQTEPQLIISTAGNFSLSGGGTAQGQDLIAYDEASGTWSLYFDHSDVNAAFHPIPAGLTAAWTDSDGNVYFSGNPIGGSALVFIEAQDGVARRNEVYENWGEGIVIGRLSDRVTVEDNISWDNSHANLYMNATTYPVADSNLIYCTDNRLWWRKANARSYRAGPGLTIRDEVFKNTNVSISVGQVVVNNMVIGCGRNFYVSSQHENGGLNDAVIANNTFYEAQGGAEAGSVNVRFEKISFDNSRFINNLIYQSTGQILRTQGALSTAGLEVSHNLYFPAAPAAWVPGEPGRIEANPQFVNPTLNTPPDPASFMLQAGSPAIDMAFALPEVVVDFFDNVRTGLPDIGAHEQGGGGGGNPTGSLTVIKTVVGSPPATDWQFTTSFAGSFSLPAAGGQRLFENLDAGSYTVTETAVSGYTAAVSCDDGTGGSDSVTVTLDAGENVVCTFTNTADTPSTGSVTIIKEVAGSPPAAPWAFSGTLGNFTLPAGGGSQTFDDVPAGAVTVTETAVGGWTAAVSCDNSASGSNSVSFDLQAEQSVTCTFVNTAQAPTTGSITVVKEVVGNPPTAPWSFSGTLGNFTLPAAGGSQTFDNLTPNNYTITESAVSGYTAAVNCSSGASGSNSVTVNLTAGQTITCTFTNTENSGPSAQTFNPVEDAFVDSGKANKNFGGNKFLKVRDSSSDFYSFLKFDVNNLSAPIQSATLRLYVTDGGLDGGAVHLVSNNYRDTTTPWIEGGLKWNNAPTISGTALDTVGAVDVGQWVEWDVTAAVTGNGIYSFGLRNGHKNAVVYSSRSGTNAPELIITTMSGPPPPPTADFSANIQTGEAPLQVAFQDLSSGFPASWQWNFGDGNVSTERHPTHTYSTPGTYSVSLTVANSSGTDVETKTNYITVNAVSPVVTFIATEDAHVDSSKPKANYGNVKTLKVRNAAADQIAYLKFSVTGLTGSVQSATLRLYVNNASPDGGTAYSVANNWTEGGIKWNNRPAFSGGPLGSAGAAVSGQWVEIDVTAAVSGNGTFSFGIENNSSNNAVYRSSEAAAAYRPQLVIVTN